MKKFIRNLKDNGVFYLCVTLVVIIVLVFIGYVGMTVYHNVISNKQILDTTFSFDRAIISLPDGRVVDGEVASWKDFEDGDQIQVKFKDGITYLTHISNVVMISE